MARKIAVFASGNGTNCENIIQHFRNSGDAEVTLVVSSNKDAFVLQRAEKHGIPSAVITRQQFEQEQALVLKLRGLEQTRVKQADALGWKGLTFRQILNRTSEQQKELLSPLFHNLSLQTKQLTGSKESADRILSLRLKEFEKALEGNLPPHFHETYV